MSTFHMIKKWFYDQIFECVFSKVFLQKMRCFKRLHQHVHIQIFKIQKHNYIAYFLAFVLRNLFYYPLYYNLTISGSRCAFYDVTYQCASITKHTKSPCYCLYCCMKFLHKFQTIDFHSYAYTFYLNYSK